MGARTAPGRTRPEPGMRRTVALPTLLKPMRGENRDISECFGAVAAPPYAEPKRRIDVRSEGS